MTPSDTSPKRILVMEDNQSDIFLLRRALDQHGVDYTLDLVRDGEKAIDMLNRIASGAAPVPDLVVLDLNLPRHDGIEVLTRCRSFPELQAMRVLILTSSDSPTERARAGELRVTEFLRKPILLDDFMALGGRIKEILERESAAA